MVFESEITALPPEEDVLRAVHQLAAIKWIERCSTIGMEDRHGAVEVF